MTELNKASMLEAHNKILGQGDIMINKLVNAESYKIYFNKYSDKLVEKDCVEIWKEYMEAKELKKSDIIAKADIGYTYFYDIMRGEKHPSRDILIKLCLAMELSVESTQKILYTYDWAYLYPDVKRDSIILFALSNKLSAHETNSLLESYNLKPLKSHK